jgi:hypothetical protein
MSIEQSAITIPNELSFPVINLVENAVFFFRPVRTGKDRLDKQNQNDKENKYLWHMLIHMVTYNCLFNKFFYNHLPIREFGSLF